MLNVAAELRRLESFTVHQLQGEFARVTGEPARSFNRTFLIKRIAWARQAAAQGGITEGARTRAVELARDHDLRGRPTQPVRAGVPAHTASPALRITPAGTDEPKSPTAAARGMPPAGSVLIRTYRGRRLEVRVLDRGFEFESKYYTSLSAVARAITGATWSGALFFGLRQRS